MPCAFFVQGAAQALEDAATLADCLQGVGRSAAGSALRRYEEIRRPRANHVLLMSRGREIRNHLRTALNSGSGTQNWQWAIRFGRALAFTALSLMPIRCTPPDPSCHDPVGPWETFRL